MPQIIIIAGPNGAGKTNFAHEWYVWDSLEDEFRLAQAWND